MWHRSSLAPHSAAGTAGTGMLRCHGGPNWAKGEGAPRSPRSPRRFQAMRFHATVALVISFLSCSPIQSRPVPSGGSENVPKQTAKQTHFAYIAASLIRNRKSNGGKHPRHLALSPPTTREDRDDVVWRFEIQHTPWSRLAFGCNTLKLTNSTNREPRSLAGGGLRGRSGISHASGKKIPGCKPCN